MVNLTKPTARVQSAYMAHYPMIRAMIFKACWSDERRQNALAWSWELFLRYYPTAENAKQAAVTAAMYAARKRQTYGRVGRSGYQDAQDFASDYGNCRGVLDKPADTATAVYLPIDKLPIKLRMVALCLLEGRNRTETAELCGVSTETVRQRVAKIETWIVKQLGGSPADRRTVTA